MQGAARTGPGPFTIAFELLFLLSAAEPTSLNYPQPSSTFFGIIRHYLASSNLAYLALVKILEDSLGLFKILEDSLGLFKILWDS